MEIDTFICDSRRFARVMSGILEENVFILSLSELSVGVNNLANSYAKEVKCLYIKSTNGSD